MKRPRKAPAPPAGTIPPELLALAQEKLESDYLGYLSGTSEEDPKRFTARLEAAQAALDHLAHLRALAGLAPEDAEPAEPSTDEVLEAARADMAHENKS